MRSSSRLKASGLFFGSVFLAGAVINICTGLASGLDIGGALSDFALVDSLVLISAALYLSACVDRVVWIQPLVFMAITPVNMMSSIDSFYGLAFYSIAILLLMKLRFFDKRRVLRTMGCVVYLVAVEIASGIKNREPLIFCIEPVFFIAVFIVFLLLTFREKIFVYLKEPKPVLFLEEKGLSPAERAYVLALLAGKGVKATAFESGVSESTVRNTLARAYKKLGVSGRSDLVSMTRKFDLR
jgi:DNA-binding CsgD family transcriptional regulator